MLPSYLLSLREGLEAALVIGILLGALRKTSRRDLTPAVWAGTFSAVLVCTAVAVGLNLLGVALKDPAEAIFEGLTMLLACGILTWMIFWMARQSHTLRSELESGVQKASRAGKRGLFLLAFIAVVREGVELALFLAAAAFSTADQQTLPGALLGLGTAILLGAIVFATSLRLNMQRFFQITGFLLVLFAAGLVIRGLGELIEVGWIPALVPHLWDSGGLVSENSILGQVLASLFGYTSSPSLVQVLAYLAYCGAALWGYQAARKRLPPAKSSPVEPVHVIPEG